jgi:hypothetical protein
VRGDSLRGLRICLGYAFSFLISTQDVVGAALGTDGEMGASHESFFVWALGCREYCFFSSLTFGALYWIQELSESPVMNGRASEYVDNVRVDDCCV